MKVLFVALEPLLVDVLPKSNEFIQGFKMTCILHWNSYYIRMDLMNKLISGRKCFELSSPIESVSVEYIFCKHFASAIWISFSKCSFSNSKQTIKPMNSLAPKKIYYHGSVEWRREKKKVKMHYQEAKMENSPGLLLLILVCAHTNEKKTGLFICTKRFAFLLSMDFRVKASI